MLILPLKPFISITPANDSAKNRYCKTRTLSFNINMAIRVVKIGEVYCMVTAGASGRCCRVRINVYTAVVPDMPLAISNKRLPPRQSTLFLAITAKQNSVDIKQRKKVVSIGGMWLIFLMQTFISAKKNVAASICSMAELSFRVFAIVYLTGQIKAN